MAVEPGRGRVSNRQLPNSDALLVATLDHRRHLDPALGFRPFDAATFDRIGAQPAVDRLVDALYTRFEGDPVIRPLFGPDLRRERQRQQLFFGEFLGGPARYSESAWAGLYQRHEDLPITRALSGRWLEHFRCALEETVLDREQRARIFAQVKTLAFGLVNHAPGADSSEVNRSSNPARHRSEKVAACGVAARTAKDALRLAKGGDIRALAELVTLVPELVTRARFAAELMQTACVSGRLNVVTWLLQQAVDPNKPWPLATSLAAAGLEGVLFLTPLCVARRKQHPEVATLLSRAGARDDVFTAAYLGDIPHLQRLLAADPSLAQVPDPASDVLTITPVHHAVGGEQLESLRALLAQSCDPIRTGARALRVAAQLRNREMVDLLLERGADARAVGAGRWVQDPELAPRLLRAGASAGIGTDGAESADWVRQSCTGNRGQKDDPAFVAALLDRGASVEQRYAGATPLHYVVKAGFVATIQVLLDHGADLNALDDRRRTPSDWLDLAAKSVDRVGVRRVLQAARAAERGRGRAPR